MSARGESLELVRGKLPIEVPSFKEYGGLEPGSEEAKAYADSLKPRRYAALAQTIGHVLSYESIAQSLLPDNSGGQAGDPWEEMYERSMNIHELGVAQAAEGEDFGTALALQQISWNLSGSPVPQSWLAFTGLLRAGADTSTATMLTLLRNIPALVRYYDADSSPETSGPEALAEIARGSVGLPWRLAMSSINQLLCARDALSREPITTSWLDVSARLDPVHFQLVRHAGAAPTLRYADLQGVEQPFARQIEGTTIAAGTPFKEVPNHNGPVIGCPITLLPKELHRLWNGCIDNVVAAGLWTPEASSVD